MITNENAKRDNHLRIQEPIVSVDDENVSVLTLVPALHSVREQDIWGQRMQQKSSIIGLMFAVLLPATGFAGHTVPPSNPIIVFSPPRYNPNERQAREAMREVGKAQSAINQAQVRRLNDFQASAEYQDAMLTARQAQVAYDRARAEIIADFNQRDDVKLVQIELWKLQQSMDAAEKPADRAAIAAKILSRRAELTRIEAGLTTDNDKLRDARYGLIDAQAKLRQLRVDFERTLVSDSEWRQARQQLETARSRLAAIGR